MPTPNPILPPEAVVALDGLLANQRIASCRIQAKTTTVDRGGARVESWGVLGDPVSCRVTPANRAVQEGIRGGRVTPEADVEIRLDRSVGVRRDNRILHVESGQRFDVLNQPEVPTIGMEVIVAGKDADG